MPKLPVFFLCFFLLSNASKAQITETLGNKEIIELSAAGLDDKTIVNKVQSSGSSKKFDVTTAGLIELKRGGVSESVINFLMNYTKTVEKNEKASWGNVDEGLLNIFETGIYFQPDNSVYFRKLDASTVTGGRVKNGIFKINEFSNLAGKMSSFLIAEARPTFYFYFDSSLVSLNRNARLSSFEDMANNPNDFKLVKLLSKKGSRSFQTQRGNETGISGRSIIPFTYSRLSSTQFKIELYAQLEEGEYCFYYSKNSLLNNPTNFSNDPNQKTVKVYDFSIKPPAVETQGHTKTENAVQAEVRVPIDVADVIELRVTPSRYKPIYKVFYLQNGSMKTVSKFPDKRGWSVKYKAVRKDEPIYLEALSSLNGLVKCRLYVNGVLLYESGDERHPKISVNKQD